MKKSYIIGALMLAAAVAAPTPSYADWNKQYVKVMIDPGHGGNDPGAGRSGYPYEAELVLRCSLAMKGWLEGQKCPLRLTRTTNATVSLQARRSASISYDPWVFCSVHLNAANGVAHGTETWHYWGGRSYNLAAKVQSNLVSRLGRANRGVKQEAWTVITGASYIPAVLTEGLFVDNPTENNMINDNSKAGFKNWVNGHLQGFKDFMNSESAGITGDANYGGTTTPVTPPAAQASMDAPADVNFKAQYGQYGANDGPTMEIKVTGKNLSKDITVTTTTTARFKFSTTNLGKNGGTLKVQIIEPYGDKILKQGTYGEGGTAVNFKLAVKFTSGSIVKETLIKGEITAPPVKPLTDLAEKWNLSEQKNNKDSKGYDASQLRNFCYKDGKIYAVYMHKDIIVLNAKTGEKLGFLKNGDVVKGGTLQLCDVKTAGGKIVACNLATVKDNENLRLYMWTGDNANPTLLKEIPSSQFSEATRIGDCIELNGDPSGDCWFSFGNQNGVTRIIEWHKTGDNWAKQTYEVMSQWDSNLSTMATVRVYHQSGGWWVDGKDSYPSWCTLKDGKAVQQTMVDTGESWGSSHHEFQWGGAKHAVNLIFNTKEYKRNADGTIVVVNGKEQADDTKNYLGGRMRIINDPTGNFSNSSTVVTLPKEGLGSTSRNTNSTGDCFVNTDGSKYLEAWVLSTTQGMAYYAMGEVPAHSVSKLDQQEPNGSAPVTTPTITVDKKSVALTCEAGKNATATVKVTGANLTGNISAWMEGANSGLFSVSPATLGAAGGNITVTYNPGKATGSHSATLCLASAGAQQVNVALTGTATSAQPTYSYADEIGDLTEGWLYSEKKGNLGQATWFSTASPASRSMAVIGDNLYVLNGGAYSTEPVIMIIDANTGQKKGELSAAATTSGGQLGRAFSIGAIGNDLYLVNGVTGTSHNFRIYKYTNAQGEPALVCDKAGVVGSARSAGFGANRIGVSDGTKVWYVDVNAPADIKSIALEEAISNSTFAYEVNFQSDGSFWIDGVTTLPRHYNAQGKLIETVANAEGMAAHQGTSNVVFNYGSHKYVALIGTPGTVWPDAYMALLDVTAGVGSPVLKAKLPESFGTSNWGASSATGGSQTKVLAQLSGNQNSTLKLWALVPLQGIGMWKFNGETQSAVENIAIDAAEADTEAAYYNLQGVRVDNTNLTPGFYIRRTAATASKVYVK